jgi:hypothetical protein
VPQRPEDVAQHPPAPPPGSAAAFALLYCPAGRRGVLQLLFALETEIGAGLARRLDHALQHARLDWWREEAARYAAGAARHPWLRAQAHTTDRTVNLAALVHGAVVDLAESQHATPRARHLRGAVFCAAAAALDPQPPTPAEQSALAALGARSAELEPGPGDAATGAAADAPAADAPTSLQRAVTDLGPARQRAWLAILVWYTVLARQATRRASALAGFGDNIAAWRAARAAAAGRLRITG